MKKVFASIACLGKDFTAQEWYDWIRSHDSGEIVFRYKEFGYNSHDVCMTPHRLTVYKSKKSQYEDWVIKTAQSPNGRWTTGYEMAHASSPVIFTGKYSNGYATEREAIAAMLEKMEEYALKNLARYEDMAARSDDNDAYALHKLKECRAALKSIAIMKDRYDLKQLTLF